MGTHRDTPASGAPSILNHLFVYTQPCEVIQRWQGAIREKAGEGKRGLGSRVKERRRDREEHSLGILNQGGCQSDLSGWPAALPWRRHLGARHQVMWEVWVLPLGKY